MANPKREQSGRPAGSGSGVTPHAVAPLGQYLDQFERIVDRISKHPSVDVEDKDTAFFSMVEHAVARVASNESNKRKQNLAYDTGNCSEPSLAMKKGLESIDKLLAAAQEIMKREPTLDREAIEYMRRLRVKVRFAVSAATGHEKEAIPSRAPELFKERKDKRENPVEFITRVYGEFLYKGITRPDILKLDKSLYSSLSTWINRSGGKMPDIGLPTRSESIDKKLQEAGDGAVKLPSRAKKSEELSYHDREKLALYAASRRRKQRTPT